MFQQTRTIQDKVKQIRSPKGRGLDYYMLQFFYLHPETPFNSKTLFWALKETGYKLNYIQVQLSLNRRKGFLFEPTTGIFMMRWKDFLILRCKNPDLAKEIIVKSEQSESL